MLLSFRCVADEKYVGPLTELAQSKLWQQRVDLKNFRIDDSDNDYCIFDIL